MAQTEEEMVEETKMLARHGGIKLKLNGNGIPDYFRQIDYFNYLEIKFSGKIEIPEWLDSVKIDTFSVSGEATDEEKEALLERFPNLYFMLSR